MNKISKIAKELIIEVFSEVDFLSEDEMAFIFLDSIRVTSLEDLKSDFKKSVRNTLKYKLKYLRSQNNIYPNRQLQSTYTEKLVEKTLELLALKIKNSSKNSEGNNMGEFLYDGYPFIEAGLIVSNEIFLEESVGKIYCITGRIISKKIHIGKEGDCFAYLTIDDFYDGLNLVILVPSGLYEEHEAELKGIEGKSIGVMGVIKHNDFYKSNILRAYELEIPYGYYIDRKPI
jgi:DNA polymerase III alpha subunit